MSIPGELCEATCSKTIYHFVAAMENFDMEITVVCYRE